MRTRPLSLIEKFQQDIAISESATAMTWIPERSQDSGSQLNRGELFAASSLLARGLGLLDWVEEPRRMAVLAFAPGLEFIQTFLACQLAGVIAIPIAMPRLGREARVLEAIIANCGVGLTITNTAEKARLLDVFGATPALSAMQIISTAELAELGRHTNILRAVPQDYAFIQYTSGSSSLPKGVVVSHANLAANLALIQQEFKVDPEFVMVNWLPHYHDMGLIGGLLTPLYGGIPCVSMAPSAFIKRPLRWLQLISAQEPARKVMSGGPNFAYQLCVDRISDQDLLELRLEAWKTAYNGAEPIRAQTIQMFAKRFSSAGFNIANMLTCYGLAETTLFATGNHNPVLREVSILALAQGRIAAPDSAADSRQLVASGYADPARIAIVDAITKRRLAAGQVGEIWITGASVPEHYFNQDELSRATFQARLADSPEQTYLVTGDIGAIVDGQLYVTGRSKELLIVNGRNLYPHDLEAMVQTAVSEIEDVAIFSYDDAQAKRESIVVFCELPRSCRSWFNQDEQFKYSKELERLANSVRLAVASAEVSLDHIRFVGPMGIIKTTSGKTSYAQNRQKFAELPVEIKADKISADFRTNL